MKLKSPWREYLIVLSIVGLLAAVNGAASSAEAGNFIETLLYLGGAIICVVCLVCIRWFVRKRGLGDRVAPLKEISQADVASVLVSRVPPERWPRPTEVRLLAECGSTGQLIEADYPGQKFPWGLYQQFGHAGTVIVIVETPKGRQVVLVKQWRPTDGESLELPAGNIGADPQKMLGQLLQELQEEVGQLEIVSVRTCQGFSHDVGREVSAEGGPKCFFPFVIQVKQTSPAKHHRAGDEETYSQWYTEEEVRLLVRSGRIADIVTLFFLVLAGLISVDDILPWADITQAVQSAANQPRSE